MLYGYHQDHVDRGFLSEFYRRRRGRILSITGGLASVGFWSVGNIAPRTYARRPRVLAAGGGDRDLIGDMSTLSGIFATVMDVCTHVASKGWAEGGAGNLSIMTEKKIPLTRDLKEQKEIGFPQPLPSLVGKRIFMSVTGSRLRWMGMKRGEGLCAIDIREATTGVVFSEPDESPSGEMMMHLHTLENMAGRGVTEAAILHVHATHCSILTHKVKPEDIEERIMSAHTEVPFVLPRGVTWAPDLPPGSLDLAAAVSEAALDADGIIMDRHGAVTIAPSLSEALDRMEVLEKAASIVWMTT